MVAPPSRSLPLLSAPGVMQCSAIMPTTVCPSCPSQNRHGQSSVRAAAAIRLALRELGPRSLGLRRLAGLRCQQKHAGGQAVRKGDMPLKPEVKFISLGKPRLVHIRLVPDAAFRDLLEPNNDSEEHHALVVKPVCAHRLTQADTIEEGVCVGFSQRIFGTIVTGVKWPENGSVLVDGHSRQAGFAREIAATKTTIPVLV
jgi:hypothetical protein